MTRWDEELAPRKIPKPQLGIQNRLSFCCLHLGSPCSLFPKWIQATVKYGFRSYFIRTTHVIQPCFFSFVILIIQNIIFRKHCSKTTSILNRYDDEVYLSRTGLKNIQSKNRRTGLQQYTIKAGHTLLVISAVATLPSGDILSQQLTEISNKASF